jgi:hypothetical protein
MERAAKLRRGETASNQSPANPPVAGPRPRLLFDDKGNRYLQKRRVLVAHVDDNVLGSAADEDITRDGCTGFEGFAANRFLIIKFPVLTRPP